MSIIRYPTISPMPTRAHLRVSTTSQVQTFANNTLITVGNWTVLVDNYNGLSGGSTYTIPVSGLYVISAGLRMSASTVAVGAVFLTQLTISTAGNTSTIVSAPYPGGAAFGNFPSITITAQLTAGATVVVAALQQSGNTLTLDGSATDNWWTITQID